MPDMSEARAAALSEMILVMHKATPELSEDAIGRQFDTVVERIKTEIRDRPAFCTVESVAAKIRALCGIPQDASEDFARELVAEGKATRQPPRKRR